MNTAAPRKANVNITYMPKGSSCAKTADEIAKYTESFSYTDAASGQSDVVSVKLNNTDLRWANKWLPKKGDKLTAEIKMQSWEETGKDKSFSCGKFCCDDLKFSGPNLVCTIGGVSVPEGQAFRATERTYTWEKATIEEMASRIADRYSLDIYYDAKKITINSMEQSGKTDCDFLNTVCEDYGLYIHGNQISKTLRLCLTLFSE